MKDIEGDLPTWQEKKELLYSRELGVDPDFLTELGDRLERAGRLNDALEFYVRAEQSGKVEAVRRRAVEEGNYFVYVRARELAGPGEDDARDEVLSLARNAMDRGKFSYAAQAFTAAGAEDEARTAREKLRTILPKAEIIFEEETP
jgi:hypothetical protein